MTDKMPDWWPDHCQYLCEIPCTRPATVSSGWDGTPTCLGHHRIMGWNRMSHGWDGFTQEEKDDMLERYKVLKEWFKDNPRPEESG